VHWKELNVWKKAHDLVLEIYRVTANFPKSEIFGITSQLRRSAYSVPANIVEGNSRNTTKDYVRFLYQARGSVEEARYFLFLSKDLEYLDNNDFKKFEEEYEKVSKLINGLIKSLNRSDKGDRGMG